jgi:hypothetical protein
MHIHQTQMTLLTQKIDGELTLCIINNLLHLQYSTLINCVCVCVCFAIIIVKMG